MATDDLNTILRLRLAELTSLTKKDAQAIAMAGIKASEEWTEKQTRSGKNPNKGGSAYPDYSEATKRIKQSKGKPSGTVWLRDEDFSIEKRRKSKTSSGAKMSFVGDKGSVFAKHQSGSGVPKRPIYPENEGGVPDVVNEAMFKKTVEIMAKKAKKVTA